MIQMEMRLRILLQQALLSMLQGETRPFQQGSGTL